MEAHNKTDKRLLKRLKGQFRLCHRRQRETQCSCRQVSSSCRHTHPSSRYLLSPCLVTQLYFETILIESSARPSPRAVPMTTTTKDTSSPPSTKVQPAVGQRWAARKLATCCGSSCRRRCCVNVVNEDETTSACRRHSQSQQLSETTHDRRESRVTAIRRSQSAPLTRAGLTDSPAGGLVGSA